MREDARGRALVVGVSGQDGAYLAQLLVSKGYRVWGTSRDAANADFSRLGNLGVAGRIEMVSFDPSQVQDADRLLEEIRPDEIYNLAGQSSVGGSFQQPVETMRGAISTAVLLESVRRAAPRSRFFNAASGECFGDAGEQACSEDTVFQPRSPYAVSKAASASQTRIYREAYGLFACNGFLFNHESPLRDPAFVTRKVVTAAVRIARGSPEQLELGDISVLRDWGWAPEYVEAMWRSLTADTPQDYVIATGRLRSLQQFVEDVFADLGLEWRQHVTTSKVGLRRPLEPRASFGDPARAREVLGWEATCHGAALAARLVRCEREGTAV